MIQHPPQQPPPVAHIGWLEYPVLYNPASAQAALRGARVNRRVRLGSLLVSIGIIVAVFLIWRKNFSDAYWWIAGVGLLLPVGLLVKAIIWELGASRDARETLDGMALAFGREGIVVGRASMPWTEVVDISVRPARWGRGASLVVKGRADQSWRIPIDHTSVGVGTLDSAVRALSGGRLWVDFAALDV